MKQGDIQYTHPEPGWEKKLSVFFSDIKQNNDDRFFHPHEFTTQNAQDICRYRGLDLYYLQVMNHRITGYGMLRGWDQGYEIPSLGMIIHPAFRSRGLGKRLIKFLHTRAHNKNAAKIRLKVYSHNISATGLYKKMGYVFSGEEDGQRVGYCDLGGME